MGLVKTRRLVAMQKQQRAKEAAACCLILGFPEKNVGRGFVSVLEQL